MSDQPKVQMNFHAPVHGAAGNVEGDLIVNATPPELDIALNDLQAFLTSLQQQHSTVTREADAYNIIDVELKNPTSNKLATLRQQLLNPERHLKATKAALTEVAKHYLEESVWAKAGITYIDTMSADPGTGA